MRGLTIAGLACLALAACGGETPPPVAEEQAVVAPSGATADADEALPPVDCTQINAVFAAFNEPTPFASLGVGPAIAPANAACKVADPNAAVPGGPVIHALNCTLYSSGALDRATSAVAAKEAFVEARRQMDACLPADWTSRDGAVNAVDANEAMIYESTADAQRAMTGSSYAYPVQLKKAWVEDGAASGWRVTLDFQKEAGSQ
jgi:hypothetical protein